MAFNVDELSQKSYRELNTNEIDFLANQAPAVLKQKVDEVNNPKPPEGETTVAVPANRTAYINAVPVEIPDQVKFVNGVRV